MAINPRDYRMPQEKPLSWHEFHDLMNPRIREAFPNRSTLRAKDVASLEGKRDLRPIRKRYPFNQYGDIPIDDYIRELYRISRNR